ncbi:hypothetical protein [Kutzneria buriramensis]|uniref:Uncharacterized protein n=1 Tax=Kutzneria buriramensis TaxID=1045776 RepID=A0A3E0GWX8_9PSEU|nr:hypothetical protein [Kutzneria buriramensis]REH31175.1 hypothetical protein BCF44_122198 [Kutzneria buriramensis]
MYELRNRAAPAAHSQRADVRYRIHRPDEAIAELRAALLDLDMATPAPRPGHPLPSRAGDVETIPLAVFDLREGSAVSAQQCHAALENYYRAMAAQRSHPMAFDEDLVPFLRACARADGFEVW